jgi:hypothetical protein
MLFLFAVMGAGLGATFGCVFDAEIGPVLGHGDELGE